MLFTLDRSFQTSSYCMQYLNDNILIDQIREGNLKSFKWLYNHYYELLCRFAYQIVGDHGKVEEIVDDVMFDLWNRREIVEIHELRAFLIGAVRNQCLKYLKSLAWRMQSRNINISAQEDVDFLVYLTDDESHPLGLLLEKEFTEKLHEAIERLPEECRNVFMLSRVENKKYSEIASELGISIDTVKYHMKKALRQLSSDMAKYLLFWVMVIEEILN